MKYQTDKHGVILRLAGALEIGHDIEKGPKPPPHIECGGYSLVDGAIVITDESLVVDAMRSQAIDEVNATRDSKFYSPIDAGAHGELDFRDNDDYVRLNGLLTSIDSFGETEVSVINAANDEVVIPAAEYKSIVGPALLSRSAIARHANALKNQLRSATTVEDIDGVDLVMGWPA